MKPVHISYVALLVAVGELLTAIGRKDSPQFYAATTAIMACFLPSIFSWLKPPAPSTPRQDPADSTGFLHTGE